jgi:hypothetical protein
MSGFDTRISVDLAGAFPRSIPVTRAQIRALLSMSMACTTAKYLVHKSAGKVTACTSTGIA